MSTDWIKMRVDLRTHPKVVRMASALKVDKLRVIGGLFSVWAIFDAHSIDGVLEGYTFRAIDDELNWKGFGPAMHAIGWLDEDLEGLTAPRFDEHNGKSAKRRATDKDRKAIEREETGDKRTKRQRIADWQTTQDGHLSASNADTQWTSVEKRREEKEKEQEKGRAASVPPLRAPPPEDPNPGHQPTAAGLACRAMRKAGLASVNPGDPRLIALCEQGATEAEFTGIAGEAVEKGKGFAWVLAVLVARRTEAVAIDLPQTAKPNPVAWQSTRDGVINRGCALGLEAFDEVAAHSREGPSWPQYRAQVIAADAAQHSRETA